MGRQQDFIRLARRELGMSNAALAQTLGVSTRTLAKWMLPGGSVDFRAAPRMAINFLGLLLRQRKASLLAQGRRADCEVIDAILTLPEDGAGLMAAMDTFDRLQRSTLFPRWERLPARPRYFRRLSDKNDWLRREEIENARRHDASADQG